MEIDLNADLGEGVTDDDALLEVVTSANLACGFHAGDPSTMRRVCDRAAGLGVVVGAQVSYCDREGFGRRDMDVEPRILQAWIEEQLEVVTAIAEAAGTRISYVKPHGALYSRVVHDAEQAAALLAASGEFPVMTLPIGAFAELASAAGIRVIHEGFPDRGYTGDGLLIPRGEPGAVVEDIARIAENAVALAARGVDSLCVHGDSPIAVDAATGVRAALEAAGWTLRSPLS